MEEEYRKKGGEESCKADGLGRRRKRGRKKIVRRFSSIGPVLSAVLMAAEPLPWAAGVPEISIWTRNILNSGTTRGREVSCTPIPSRGNDKTSFSSSSSFSFQPSSPTSSTVRYPRFFSFFLLSPSSSPSLPHRGQQGAMLDLRPFLKQSCLVNNVIPSSLFRPAILPLQG